MAKQLETSTKSTYLQNQTNNWLIFVFWKITDGEQNKKKKKKKTLGFENSTLSKQSTSS